MILARHAEAMFWAGRQLERTEHTTRVLDITTRDSMHFRDAAGQNEWERVLEALGLNRGYTETGRPRTASDVVDFLFFDEANHGSVVASVHQLRENVRSVRDRVPVELWEEANRLHLALRALDSTLPPEPFELYSTVRRRCHAISGIISETMPRGDGFTFLVVGRMIERAIMVCRTIRCFVISNDHALDESSVLRMISSLQAFRRRSGVETDELALATFLLQTGDVPRTVMSCLRRADGRLQGLRQDAPGLAPAVMVCGRIRAQLEFGDTQHRLQTDPERFCLEIEAELINLSSVIAEYAFNPAQIPTMQAQFIRPGTGL